MPKNLFKAVIFDMDGILADTEPLWRMAMVKEFKNAGISFNEEDCRLTTGMRFREVVEFWNLQRPFKFLTTQEVHDKVIASLCDLINKNEVVLSGVKETIETCINSNLKIGLATSSNRKVIDAVLNRLELCGTFHAVHSAENLEFGKPHPKVFLDCADSLKVLPQNCLVLEDSVNGVIAAKAAFMKVVAVPDERNFNDERFSIADFKISSLKFFPSLFKKIASEVPATA
jgi:sugar-phosphatase